MAQPRQPKGVPIGGQYAPALHEESPVALMDPPEHPDEALDEPRVFAIPMANWADFERRFGRITKRAEKMGVPVPSFEIHDERLVEMLPDHPGRFMQVREVTVTGKAPRYDGWEPIAFIQRDTDEPDSPNLVFPIGEHESDPTWRSIGDVCEHCNKNHRGRKKLLVMEHTDGSRKTVGSACAKDFLGHSAPSSIAAWCEVLVEDYGDLEEWDAAGDMSAHMRYDPKGYMDAVAAVIDANGWVPKSRSGTDNPATSTLATKLITEQARPGIRDESIELTDQQRYVDEALAWAAEQEGHGDDYLANLAAVAGKETWGHKDLGLAASIIPAYQRHLERAAIEAAKAAQRPSEHLGTVGEKLSFEAKVIGVHTFPGYAYNSPDRAIVSMITPEGDRLVWKASNVMRAPEQGDTVTMSGTVKEHGEFRGDKQTIVTRCKWELDELDEESGAETDGGEH